MFLRSTMFGLHCKKRDLMDGSEGAGAFCDFMEHWFGNGGHEMDMGFWRLIIVISFLLGFCF